MKNFFILLIFIAIGCKTSKSFNESEGKLERKLIENNPHYKTGKVIFAIREYKFRFDLNEFNSELNKRNYKLSSSFETLNIVQKKNVIIVDQLLKLHPINSYEINEVLNLLFKEGKFYATKNDKQISNFEYLNWQPKQGEIFIKWFDGNYIIRKTTLGFSD